MARLKDYYTKEVVPALIKEFHYKNPMEVPKMVKIVVNMGLGEAIQNVKILDSAVEEMTTIVGQKPVITKARKSIATFKLRQGMSIGCCVTLRRERMYEFFDRLVNVALPRVRDFRGIPAKSFDGRGNFALGSERADHLSGDRIRQDRKDQGHEYCRSSRRPRRMMRQGNC